MTNTIDLRSQTFGVEIETEELGLDETSRARARNLGEGDAEHIGEGTISDRMGRVWHVVPDGSLRNRGAEVVNPVLSYEDLGLVAKVAEGLGRAGARATASCGLHIHVGMEDADAFQLANLVKTVDLQEEIIFKALDVSEHRMNSYCQPLNQRLVGVCSQIIRRFPLTNGADCPFNSRVHYTRYHGLNIRAYGKHGTVEYRYFNGTLDCSKITAYVQFCLALTARGKNVQKTKHYRRAFNPATARYDLRVFLNSLELKGEEFA